MDYKQQLEVYRQQIDEIDHQLVELLVKRFDVVLNVGALKKQYDQPVLDASREAKVLEKIVNIANKAEYDNALKSVYQEIMDQAKLLEK